VDVRELVPGFEPESLLERTVVAEPDLLAGLAWGRPRPGHPEGTVGRHVADLLERVDEAGDPERDRADLRFVVIVHDAFKYQVLEFLPRVGENHHAARAHRFAERFVDDERLLNTIRFHDAPYGIWRAMMRRGIPPEPTLTSMLEHIPDLDLFLRFVELDGSTEGKNPEPVRWFRDRVRRRVDAA